MKNLDSETLIKAKRECHWKESFQICSELKRKSVSFTTATMTVICFSVRLEFHETQRNEKEFKCQVSRPGDRLSTQNIEVSRSINHLSPTFCLTLGQQLNTFKEVASCPAHRDNSLIPQSIRIWNSISCKFKINANRNTKKLWLPSKILFTKFNNHLAMQLETSHDISTTVSIHSISWISLATIHTENFEDSLPQEPRHRYHSQLYQSSHFHSSCQLVPTRYFVPKSSGDQLNDRGLLNDKSHRFRPTGMQEH